MWKGVDERKIIVSVRFLSVLREGVLFFDRWCRVTRSWDHGGVAGWFGNEKTVFRGGTLAIGGRMGAVGTCDGIFVTLRVDSG